MKIVTFGEILLRLAPPGFQRFTQARSFDAIYGGGEANVAVSLANFGEEVELVTRLPKNDLTSQQQRLVSSIVSSVISTLSA